MDEASSTMKGDKGIFGSRKIQSIICAAFLPDGSYVTGSHGGEIIAWKKNNMISVIDDAHKGPVYGVSFHPEFGIISSGQDGKIILRDNHMQVVDEIEMEAGVRSSCISSDGKTIIVGLSDSTIVQVKTLNKSAKVVLEAHSAVKLEELWGLAVNPVDSNEFATCGDDNRVFRWNSESRASICSNILENTTRAICYSPDGSVLAIGNVKGDVSLLTR
jgi:WD40 repeat protein